MENMNSGKDGDYSSSEDGSWTSTSQEQHSSSEQSRTSSTSLAASETRIVRRSKTIVYICLFVVGVGVGVLVYFLVAHGEQNTFETEFKGHANDLLENTLAQVRETIGQVESLATSITSYTSTTETYWPNFTLPHFEERTAQARALSGAELIAFVPIVPRHQKAQWEQYAQENQGWIERGLAVRGLSDVHPGEISPVIYSNVNNTSSNTNAEDLSFDAPVWQIGPAPKNARVIMQELLAYEWFKNASLHILEFHHTVITRVVDLEFLVRDSRERDVDTDHPRTAVIARVTKTIFIEGEKRKYEEEIVGFVIAVIPWEFYFENVLPQDVNGILVEVDDNCGSRFSYMVNGEHATFYGPGDHHDPVYKDLTHTLPEFADFFKHDHKGQLDDCRYSLEVGPTDEFRDAYTSAKPFLYAFAMVSVFVVTTGVFLMYDLAVQRRQNKVMSVAKRTNDIVASLFPKQIQKRIMEEARETAAIEEAQENNKTRFGFSIKDQLKDALALDRGQESCAIKPTSAPIADFFPEVTIMFANLVGFTAWSSMREPAQVFMLLETVYGEFDVICKKRRIFKVETVGDCYVTASGLPDPRKDHAVAMARFARDCKLRTMSLMNELEVKLGPDTGDLGIRIGIHSGPVTAGVLRGDKARFQLFGDTMNTTSHIESTGRKNVIHISEETANLLKGAGKGHWLRVRHDKITAKGKGELTTYWLDKTDHTEASTSASSMSDILFAAQDVDHNEIELEKLSSLNVSPNVIVPQNLSDKQHRLIQWNAEVLSRLLKEVVLHRQALGVMPDSLDKLRILERTKPNGMVLDEVADIIHLPAFDAVAAKRQEQLPPVELSEAVQMQLHMYLQTIAALYRKNPFHNFEHVSHVLMSVNKLLSRIVAPDLSDKEGANEKTLHDHTYGITSDPLTQFAVVFAALIHDVDHQGVPNAQLVKEKTSIALVYQNKSVAEQNSVDIAWRLLMDDSFSDLRRVIYTTEAEFRRFRQLVINAVMATDIMDKELGNARKVRWNTAFSNDPMDEPEMTTINRKATIVIDHLIQASDVAHTMQHWHIYVLWNSRLFEEMTLAYRAGRLENDPAEKWYEGEMGFFDFYIIPLAKKLKDCGVFGVSSDEYLNYAVKNRKEWELKGKEIVAQLVEDMSRNNKN